MQPMAVQLQTPGSSLASTVPCMEVLNRGRWGRYTFWFCFSGDVLVMYWHGNNPIQGCGIQCLVRYGKGSILGL